MQSSHRKVATLLILGGSLTVTACELDLSGLDFSGWGGGWSGSIRHVVVSPDTVLFMGDTVRFTAEYHDSTGVTGGSFTWTSTDTTLLSVDADGSATAKLPGWAEIIALHEASGVAGSRRVPVLARASDLAPAMFEAISVGARACGVAADGTTSCWGPEHHLDSSGARSTPTPVPGDSRFVQVLPGFDNTCALTAEGVGYCWGRNFGGSLGVGDYDPRATPEPVSGSLSFHSLEAGSWHTCGLTLDGIAYCWGTNEWGQLGIGAAGEDHLVPVQVAGEMEFRALAVGLAHTCGIAADSLAYCWGENRDGALGTGSSPDRHAPTPVAGDHRFLAIETLGSGSCGIDSAGSILCWGWESSTGTIRLQPVLLDDSRRYESLTGMFDHMCALTDSGQALCWGGNWAGQLGDGSNAFRPTPVAVAGDHRFGSLSAGASATCGRTLDGAAYCWGDNHEGVLGTGTLENSATPVRVMTLK